jgi:hypothetical protein
VRRIREYLVVTALALCLWPGSDARTDAPPAAQPAAAATASTAAPATRTTAPPHSAAECEDLLKQFDVAWPSHSELKHADDAKASRDKGAAGCAAGNYGDGVRDIRRGLHAIGVKPVKIVVAKS